MRKILKKILKFPLIKFPILGFCNILEFFLIRTQNVIDSATPKGKIVFCKVITYIPLGFIFLILALNFINMFKFSFGG